MSILLVVASVMGAAGVALMAASAHAKPGAGLDSAGYLLLFHAAATFGVVAALGQGLVWRPLAIAGTIGLVVGAGLFAGDVVLRAYAGHRLFPMAAPIGGLVLILAWLVVAVSAIVVAIRG